MIAEIEEKEARKPLFAIGSLSQKRLLYDRVISINGRIVLKKSQKSRGSKYTSFFGEKNVAYDSDFLYFIEN